MRTVELGKTVTKHGVHIIGQPNLAATVATDSSALYARNVLDFLKLVVDKEGNFVVPADHDIVAACLAVHEWRNKAQELGETGMETVGPIVINLIIFVLAIYVGYHVVWNVTPVLHMLLMSVTNAISAIIIVGAMLAAVLTETVLGKTMGVLAVALAAVNVFGGFLVTRRMLEMFRKKERK